MKKQLLSRQSVAGYTLIEVLIVVIMIGVLAAIAAPGWVAFLNRQRLNSAQDKALMALRDAQAKARSQKSSWQACFQDDGTEVLYSVTSGNLTSGCQLQGGRLVNAQSLIGKDSQTIQVASNLTPPPTAGTPIRVLFNFDGSVVPDSGVTLPIRLTFTPRSANTNPPKTCVYVETLLGALRTAKNNDCGT